MMLPMAVMGQSNKDIESAAQEMKMLLDSIRPERKVFFMEIMESIILAGVDSLEQEGMYIQALETCDSLSVQIKKNIWNGTVSTTVFRESTTSSENGRI